MTSLGLMQALSRVVIPAVEEVLDSNEVVAISLSWAEDSLTGESDAAREPRTINLHLQVADETFHDVIFDEVSGASMSDQELSDRLVSNLVDFIAESKFAWGQNRDPYRP